MAFHHHWDLLTFVVHSEQLRYGGHKLRRD